jgi:hypothetical protein
MASAFNKFHSFSEALAEGHHNLGADTIKAFLTNTQPTTSDVDTGDLTEISTGNGYDAGGPTISITSSTQTSGTYKLVLADNVIEADGGPIGPFRYVVLTNSTASGLLIGWFDYASPVTIEDGETFTIDFSADNGVITLA